MWLDVLPKILVCCVYIPPGSDENLINQLLDLINLLPSDNDIILLGDFNVPDVNWDAMTASTSRSAALCECIFNNLIQMVTGPTHVWEIR